MRTLEDKLQLIELRANGISYQRIADILRISKPTAIKLGKELENEVAVRKQEMLEEFRDRYSLQLFQRLEYLGGLFESFKSEWQSRDLQDLSDREVLSSMLRVYRELVKELEPSKRGNLPARLPVDESIPATLDEDFHAPNEIEPASSPVVFTSELSGPGAELPESMNLPPTGSIK